MLTYSGLILETTQIIDFMIVTLPSEHLYGQRHFAAAVLPYKCARLGYYENQTGLPVDVIPDLVL